MAQTLLNLLLAGFVGLVCVGFGWALLYRFGVGFSHKSEELALSAGVGAAFLVYAMVVLGFAGFYSVGVAWALIGSMALVAAWGWLRIEWLPDARGLTAAILRSRGVLTLILAVAAVYGMVYLLVVLAPTLEGDSLAGYMIVAREYADDGGIASVEYAYTNVFPANGQMLTTAGFLLRGQILAQLMVVWLPGLLALAAMYAIGRPWLSRRAILVGMAVWYGTFAVGYLAQSGKIDLAWAAFELLALLAFSRWYFVDGKERDWRWLVLTGLFLGVAGGTKQASLFAAVAIGAAVAFRLWEDRTWSSRTWIVTYALLALPATIAVLWVARAYVITDSPPFTGSSLPGESGFIGFFRVLWDMSMGGNAPGTAGNFGKAIGPAILAIVPLVIALRNVDRRVWHLLAFSALVVVMWYFGVQRARHLLPALALLSLIAGYVLVRLVHERPLLGQSAVVLAAAALAINLATWTYINHISLERVQYVVGIHDTQEYLDANLPQLEWYPNGSIVSYSRRILPADARIAALSTANSFYLDRPFYPDYTSPNPDRPDDASAFRDKLEADGITHVFTNEYAVVQRGLQSAWFAQPGFRDEFLTELVCDDGQCLYALR